MQGSAPYYPAPEYGQQAYPPDYMQQGYQGYPPPQPAYAPYQQPVHQDYQPLDAHYDVHKKKKDKKKKKKKKHGKVDLDCSDCLECDFLECEMCECEICECDGCGKVCKKSAKCFCCCACLALCLLVFFLIVVYIMATQMTWAFNEATVKEFREWLAFFDMLG